MDCLMTSETTSPGQIMRWRTTSRRAHRWLLHVAVLGAAVAGLATIVVAQSVFPTGTTRYDPTKAFNSFVLFTSDSASRLIDMNGNPIHEWKNAGDLATLIDPALAGGARGHVLVTMSVVATGGTDLTPGRNGPAAQTIGELDWTGKVVWTFGEKAPDKLARQHHDWARLPNHNTLVLSTLFHAIAGFKLPQLRDDVIYDGPRDYELSVVPRPAGSVRLGPQRNAAL
jgi:hypothetical protein